MSSLTKVHSAAELCRSSSGWFDFCVYIWKVLLNLSGSICTYIYLTHSLYTSLRYCILDLYIFLSFLVCSMIYNTSTNILDGRKTSSWVISYSTFKRYRPLDSTDDRLIL